MLPSRLAATMIEETERYRRITVQMTFFAERIRDNFKIFLQFSIATIGGFIWLTRKQYCQRLAATFG
jgi:hypothetical protein